MSYSAKILLDSISETEKRITTFEVTFPRIVLAEFNTHRMFSRNSASSRAIPFDKQVERVKNNPFIPEQFPLNSKGMQPQEYVTINNAPRIYEILKNDWLEILEEVIEKATNFREIFDLFGTRISEDVIEDIENEEDYKTFLEKEKFSSDRIHKQLINRLLEPFMWHTVIITATEFDNFFKLRTNEQAQYEIKRIADLMYDLYNGTGTEFGIQQDLKVGEWHLPLFNYKEDVQLLVTFLSSYLTNKEAERYRNEFNGRLDLAIIELSKRISVARCARVSYLTHDGKRDIEKDLELFERLRTSGHWSPFEHIATPYFDYSDSANNIQHSEGYQVGWNENKTWIDYRSGNFIGWKQFRKEFQDENCTSFRKGE
jgi:thymidylate synthase ThyX